MTELLPAQDSGNRIPIFGQDRAQREYQETAAELYHKFFSAQPIRAQLCARQDSELRISRCIISLRIGLAAALTVHMNVRKQEGL